MRYTRTAFLDAVERVFKQACEATARDGFAAENMVILNCRGASTGVVLGCDGIDPFYARDQMGATDVVVPGLLRTVGDQVLRGVLARRAAASLIYVGFLPPDASEPCDPDGCLVVCGAWADPPFTMCLAATIRVDGAVDPYPDPVDIWLPGVDQPLGDWLAGLLR